MVTKTANRLCEEAFTTLERRIPEPYYFKKKVLYHSNYSEHVYTMYRDNQYKSWWQSNPIMGVIAFNVGHLNFTTKYAEIADLIEKAGVEGRYVTLKGCDE